MISSSRTKQTRAPLWTLLQTHGFAPSLPTCPPAPAGVQVLTTVVLVQVFVQVLTAVYIFQAVMIALLSIKRFPWVPLMLPCCLATGLFHSSARQLLRRPSQVLALQDARELDQLDVCAGWQPRQEQRPASGSGELHPLLQPAGSTAPPAAAGAADTRQQRDQHESTALAAAAGSKLQLPGVSAAAGALGASSAGQLSQHDVANATLARQLYTSPAFQSTEGQLQQLLAEVADVRRRLQRGRNPG